MDRLLKLKQIGLKVGIPLVILVFLIFVLSSGINTQDKKSNVSNDINNMSLFKEDELVATRYTDSIEDKLNIAVSSQDNLKSENEKMKKELEALKNMILEKDKKPNNSQNFNNEKLYDSFPQIPDLMEETNNSNFGIDLKKEPKVLYRLMDQNVNNTENPIDTSFGKREVEKLKR